ncbi:MAG: enoyl-CoA hydratase/isomerase family protein [bacterium]
MGYKNLLVEKKETIAIVTINRPEVLNSLDAMTVKEIYDCFDRFKSEESVSAVIITGSGDKSFVAGADINELKAADRGGGLDISHNGQAALGKVEALSKPVIAAVNGYALGGGCELAMACDMRVASERAKFGQPEVTLGLIPGYGGTQRLSRLVGKGVAKRLILTGEIIDAQEALRIGLVEKVVPHEKLMEEAEALAVKLAGLAPVALKLAKESVDLGFDLPLKEALKVESERFGEVCATKDKNEGTAAFLEKRKPAFKGE